MKNKKIPMNNMSDRLTIKEYNGRKIIFVDYKGLKEKEMIELAIRHIELTLETKLPFLADYRNTYATPGFLVYVRQFMDATKNIIDKGALVGVDQVKSWILKGLLYTYPVNYKSFETVDKAIEFLTTETDSGQNPTAANSVHVP